MSFRPIRDFRPVGHAYFRDSRNRIYVADNSGHSPADTDDGPLVVEVGGEFVVDSLRVPLEGGTHTIASGEEAQWLWDFIREIKG